MSRLDARATRERILDAARRAARATGQPSLVEVANAAGVSRATVHRHFPTRSQLMAAVDLPPDPATRDRLLEAAVAILDQAGLAAMSVEVVAERAGVSRAAAYRLFPGRAMLFREVVREFAPFEEIAQLLDQIGDRPPDVVIPTLLVAIATRIGARPGLVRTLLLEFTGTAPDADEGRRLALEGGLARFVEYLARQMAGGRLRPADPLVALQALAGPLVFHLATRRQAERLLGLTVPVETVAREFAALWLRAMSPESTAGPTNQIPAGGNP